MTDSSEPNDMSKSESYKDDPEGKQKDGNLGGNPNIEDETKSVEMNGSTSDGSEPNDMPKAESYKDDRIEVSKSGPEGRQKGENLDGNPSIDKETKNVETNGSTADGSEPSDMPKAESFNGDMMELSKSGPEGKQKVGNLDGNPNIEDKTKSVEMNQSLSGVANDAVMSNVSPICFFSR